MPNGDPRDGYFYPTLTLMIDSYSMALKIYNVTISLLMIEKKTGLTLFRPVMALVVCSLVGFLVKNMDCSLIIVYCLNFGDLFHRSPCAFYKCVCVQGEVVSCNSLSYCPLNF